MNLLYISLIVFFLNVPFGYWRAHVKKLSLQWFLAVHVPVPFVIALRFIGHLGFQLYTYPALVGAFFLGQFAGGWLLKKLTAQTKVSSCLVMDLYRWGWSK
ncbi:MAG: hypothetical protein J7K46_00925 [Bacteroidales bacterium]|nr:hypothetical protein [Bacteroidales bacterium]